MITAAERLTQKGLSITKPRIAILDYLMKNHTHPVVDVIYQALRQEYPNISMTTVYNTVKVLKDNGLVQMLTIDGKQICVDEDTSPHAHLLCEKCGKVIDVPIQGIKQQQLMDGHIIHEVHQYYKGVCKYCLNKNTLMVNK